MYSVDNSVIKKSNYYDYNDNNYYSHNYPNYDYSREYCPQPKKNSSNMLFSVGILEALTYGVKKLSEFCVKKLASGKEFTSPENIYKMADLMIDKNNLDVTIFSINKYNVSNFGDFARKLKDVAAGNNAFYVNKLKSVFIPEAKPSLVLHELGHAVNAKKIVPSILQKMRNISAHIPTALLIAAATESAVKQTKNDSSESKIGKYAGFLGFASMLPTIVEEGLASGRGISAAKKVLGKAKEINILRKNYFFALCTYILSGVCVGLISKETIVANKDEANGYVYY